MDESRGFLKVIADRGTAQILGRAVFGIDCGQIVAMLRIAMMGKRPYTVLKEAIFAHPPLAGGSTTCFWRWADRAPAPALRE